jgi:hypothetical protein
VYQLKKKFRDTEAEHWWLMPVTLTNQEAEIRRIAVQSQPGQIVCETLSQKKNLSQKRAGRVAQGVGPEFKLQHCKKKKIRDTKNLISLLSEDLYLLSKFNIKVPPPYTHTEKTRQPW